MPNPTLNRFLTPLDAAFLYFERPSQTMHIGSCMIYEGRVEREEMIQLLAQRLHLAPRYRQRVLSPPMRVSHPLWIDDPGFDIAQHVEELELPDGADERLLGSLVARAYRGMLDRRRPLWKAILLHGVEGANTAVVWKVHHAMIDGISGVDLTTALNDLKADAEPPSRPDLEWKADPLPDPVSLLQECVGQRLGEIGRSWTDAAFDLLRPSSLAGRWRQLNDAAVATWPSALRPAPRTPFNGRLSGELDYAWAEYSFAELRRVKSVLGGTVNDLVLAILSGALGRYLRSRGRSTDGLELRAMCPVSMRRPDERGKLGNLVSVMVAPLFVGITDPLERLEAERRAMSRLKEAGQAEGLYELTRMGERVPPAWMAFAGLLPPTNTLFNTVSTNVPGPQIPLYMGGRQLLAWYPLGILSANIGLFVAILTYNQRITIGVTVDPRLVPDVWRVSDSLQESYAELREIAGVEEVEPMAIGRRGRQPEPAILSAESEREAVRVGAA